MTALYDDIGRSYSATLREEPRLRDRIQAALGDARTVTNVGAAAGNYEPCDRDLATATSSPPRSSTAATGC